MTARSAHLPSYRSIPLRPLTGAMPSWPLVLGSDAVIVGPLATNGEFLCSVKAVTAMTMTIAAMMSTMAPLPHSPSRSLRFGIASPPLWGPGVPMLHRAQRTADTNQYAVVIWGSSTGSPSTASRATRQAPARPGVQRPPSRSRYAGGRGGPDGSVTVFQEHACAGAILIVVRKTPG